jgi:hypothetical protein
MNIVGRSMNIVGRSINIVGRSKSIFSRSTRRESRSKVLISQAICTVFQAINQEFFLLLHFRPAAKHNKNKNERRIFDMNSKLVAKLNMYDAVKAVCQDNTTTVAAINAFKTALDEFKDKITAIKEAAQQKDLATTGIAADKKVRKQNLSRLASAVAGAL